MTELKEKALAKMNDEMSKPHSDVLDFIHNYFCEQEDETLLTSISKDGKSLEGAYNFMVKMAKEKHYSCISDAEGFRLMTEYFLGNETDVKAVGYASTKPISATPKTIAPTKNDVSIVPPVVKHEAPKKVDKPKEYEMTSMFDFLDEPEKDPADIDLSDVAIKEMVDQPEPDYGLAFGDEDNEINE